MFKQKSTYQILYDLIERSIFIYQVKDVESVIKYIKQNSQFKSLNPIEIEKIMWKVCTSSAQNKNKEKPRKQTNYTGKSIFVDNR